MALSTLPASSFSSPFCSQDQLLPSSRDRNQSLKNDSICSIPSNRNCRFRNHGFHVSSHGIALDPEYSTIDHDDQPSGISAMQRSFLRIQKAGVIACVRADSAELALDMARTALDGGLSVLEVTMTTPGATKVINKLVEEYPPALIGAGTVLSTSEADVARAAGAKFLMSPVALKESVESHSHGPVLFIPGAITPTEVLNAYNWGALLVKLYPVALMGGVQLVRALRKSLHQIPLVASQGITMDMLESYIAAGATAVVLSDAIFDKILVDARDFQKIKQRAILAAEKSGLAVKNLNI